MKDWDEYGEDDTYDDDNFEITEMDRYDVDREAVLQEIIEEYFGGISKEEIIAVLKEHYPESFD